MNTQNELWMKDFFFVVESIVRPIKAADSSRIIKNKRATFNDVI